MAYRSDLDAMKFENKALKGMLERLEKKMEGMEPKKKKKKRSWVPRFMKYWDWGDWTFLITITVVILLGIFGLVMAVTTDIQKDERCSLMCKERFGTILASDYEKPDESYVCECILRKGIYTSPRMSQDEFYDGKISSLVKIWKENDSMDHFALSKPVCPK